MEYRLPLAATDSTSTRRMTTLHLMLAFVLCGLGAGCLVLYWFTTVSPKFTTAFRPFLLLGISSLLVGLVITAIAIFNKGWLMQGKRSTALRVAEVLILVSAGATFAIAGQWRPAAMFGIIAIAVVVATLWESRKPAAQEAMISELGIILPKGGLPKTYRWTEIEAVLLRHGILSIELSGNRLLQKSLNPEAGLDGAAIEAFCQQYIKQYEKARASANSW